MGVVVVKISIFYHEVRDLNLKSEPMDSDEKDGDGS